jgi:hypothetical protein
MNLSNYKLPRDVMFKLMSLVDYDMITVIAPPKRYNSDLLERYRFISDYIQYKNNI